MPSGFWFLKDGRGYSRRVTFMFDLMKKIWKELTLVEGNEEFSKYLEKFILTEDHERNGYGGVFNKVSDETVMMDIDFREFAPSNQEAFWEAAQNLLTKRINKNSIKDRVLIKELKILMDMNKRANKGENPMKLNHMRGIEAPTGKKIGPGWPAE